MRKIKKEILEKIKKNEVKMKPKWWFVAEANGIRGIYLGLIAVAALGIVALIEWNELSELGYNIIMEDFPIWWSTGLIVGLILAVIIISRAGNNYKRNLAVWLITTMSLIVAVTFLLEIFL